MGGWLSEVIREGISIADETTETTQVDVLHYRYEDITKDAYRKITWGDPFVRSAIVEHKRVQVVTDSLGDGKPAEQIDQIAPVLTFIQPVNVDPRDRFTLPDDNEGIPGQNARSILHVEGMLNPETGRTYMTEVTLGRQD